MGGEALKWRPLGKLLVFFLFFFFCRIGSGFEVGDGFSGQPFGVYAYVLGLGFDFLRDFFLIVFLVFEIFPAPGIFSERGLVYSTGINDDAGFYHGFEIDSAQVRRCSLQGVEEQAGGFRVHLSAEDQAHDLHERDLDGVGVFEHRQVEGGASAAGAVGIEDDAGFLPTFMKVTKVIAFQRGRSALSAVDFQVFATRNAIGIKRHKKSPPPPPLIYWNQRDSGGLGLKSLS
jgi:hypothetical protein